MKQSNRVLVAVRIVLLLFAAACPFLIGSVTSPTAAFWRRTTESRDSSVYLSTSGADPNATSPHSFNATELSTFGSRFSPRQANNVFDSAQKRGKRLLCMLTDRSVAQQTPFKEYKELEDWGWTLKKLEDQAGTQHILYSVQKFFQEKRLGLGAPPNVNMKWKHGKKSTHKADGKGQEYPPTGGEYNNVFNPVDGVVVAYANYGPEWAVKNSLEFPQPQGAPLPQLKQWSDVIYLTWQSLTTAQQRANLKWVLRMNVENKDSIAIISAAMKAAGISNGVPPPYPGKTFEYAKTSNPLSSKKKTNAAFQALVGSPNVSGVAWILIQHFEAMGKKTIASLTVWDNDNNDGDGTDFTAIMAIELKPVSEMPKVR